MPETTQFAGMGGDGVGGGDGLKPNTILLARYKVLGVLGGGGMGTVYQARDLNFPDVKRLVAIKEMLNPNTDPNLRASTLKTFQREANILATLTHPAIPKIFDFFDQNDRAYLVMEYINGLDMENMMAKAKDIPIEKILEWSMDLCDVLDYLHKNQPEPIIFRDMKPSNVMIDHLGKVRLIDFGIAKNFVSGVKNTMIGTEGYSAPEQYKGDVNPLSDVYSLGATLHHLLTRRDPRLEPPFSFNERPIKDFNPKCPQGLIDIVMKALSFEPKERFSSCADMKAALDKVRYGTQQPLAVAPQKPPTGPTQPKDDTKFFDDEVQTGPGIQPKWKFKTEDEIRCTPTAYKTMAYVGSYDTNIWALKLDTGEFVWKFPTRGGIASSPVVDNDNRLVLFGSEDYSFTAVDANSGRISWSYPTKDKIRGTARVAHGHVFFGSDDGRLYALVAANGRYLWEYDTGAPVRSRPFVTNDIVIVGSESGEIIGLELSGKRKWAYRTKKNVTSSPYVDMLEGICYVGSADGYLYAIDATSGFSSWRYRTSGPVYSSPVVEDGICYFGSADGTLYAINAQTSRDKWKFETGGPIVSSPVVQKGAVYVGNNNGILYCIDAATGKERWKFTTQGGIPSAPFIADNTILVGSMDKTLYAFPLVG